MALVALGRWDEVLAEMRVALNSEPENLRALVLKGEALLGKGEFPQAEAILARARKQDPSNSKVEQLLKEIAESGASGFDAHLTEAPSFTRLYPAKAKDLFAEETSETPPPMVPMPTGAPRPSRREPVRAVVPPPPPRVEARARKAAPSPAVTPDPEVDPAAFEGDDHTVRQVGPPVYGTPLVSEDSSPTDPHSEVSHEIPPIASALSDDSFFDIEPSQSMQSTQLLAVNQGSMPASSAGKPLFPSLAEAGHRNSLSSASSNSAPSDREPPFEFHRAETVLVNAKSLAGARSLLPLAGDPPVAAPDAKIRAAAPVPPVRRFGAELIVLIAVLGFTLFCSLLVREWRLRARLGDAEERANAKIAVANYPSCKAAELDYRQMLSERSTDQVRMLRTRLLAQIAFEFSDSIAEAERAVIAGGREDTPEILQAKIFLSLTKGELEHARAFASELKAKAHDGPSQYAIARVELSDNHPALAIELLRGVVNIDPADPFALHALGLAEAAAKHDERALDAYRRALELNPSHIATLIDRALLQLRRGDREAARSALETVTSKLAGDASPGQLARAYLGLGDLELSRGSLQSARRDLDQAVAKRRDGDLLLDEALARSLVDAFELDQAERVAQHAAQSSPALAPRLVLAEVALKRGDPQAVLNVLKDAGANKSDVLVLRALAELQLGQTTQARTDVDTARRIDPESISARIASARIDLATGQTERAQKELEQIERSHKQADVAAAMGELYGALHEYDRARYWLNEALRLQPLLLDARLSLARSLRQVGRTKEATDELRRILQSNAAYLPARRELAELNLAEGDAFAARDEYELLLGRQADRDTVLGAARAYLALEDGASAEKILIGNKVSAPILLARAYVLERRFDEALKEMTTSDSVTASAEGLSLSMQIESDRGHPERALDLFGKATPVLRSSSDVLLGAARAQADRGQTKEALKSAQAALARLRSSHAPHRAIADASLMIGQIYLDHGAFRPALLAVKEATAADPTHPRAFLLLAQVFTKLNRPNDAHAAQEQAAKNALTPPQNSVRVP